jgi:hypothetical protein
MGKGKYNRKSYWAGRRSSTSWVRRSTRFAVYARDRFECAYCPNVFPPAYDGVGLTLDHIVPRSAGGSNAPTNLITACFACNHRRNHAPLPHKVRAEMRRRAKRPLNRELGRFLVKLYEACRGGVHPMTGRSPWNVGEPRAAAPGGEEAVDVQPAG